MNLIYYFPTRGGSPDQVGRKILVELIDHFDILPFDEIKLYCKNKHVNEIKKQFKNLEVITYKDLKKISNNDLIHIPILPTILPNSKFILYIYSKIKKTKLILQYHGDVRTELKTSYKDIKSLIHILTYIYVPNLLKSADGVITHSYYMDKIIKKYGVNKSTVIPNALDNYWFQPLKNNHILAKEVIDTNNFNIFYHGRLSWEKGVDLLLEAVGSYTKQQPNTKIYLAGDGPQKKYLKEQCLKLGICENVIFLGYIDKETIKFFLNCVDVAIYPSRFDNFPLSVLEALACADCQVFFSKNIGIYDFVIRDKFQLNYFELTIEKLIDTLNSISFENDKKIIRYQIDFAQNYTWDSMIYRYIKLYKEVLNS